MTTLSFTVEGTTQEVVGELQRIWKRKPSFLSFSFVRPKGNAPEFSAIVFVGIDSKKKPNCES